MRVNVFPGIEIKNRTHNSNSEPRFLTLNPTQIRHDYTTAHGKRKHGVLGMKEESGGTVDLSRIPVLYILSYSKKLLLHVQGIANWPERLRRGLRVGPGVIQFAIQQREAYRALPRPEGSALRPNGDS